MLSNLPEISGLICLLSQEYFSPCRKHFDIFKLNLQSYMIFHTICMKKIFLDFSYNETANNLQLEICTDLGRRVEIIEHFWFSGNISSDFTGKDEERTCRS